MPQSRGALQTWQTGYSSPHPTNNRNSRELRNQNGSRNLHMCERFLFCILQLQQIPNAPDMVCFCCQTDLQSAMIFRRQCILQQKKWVPLLQSDKVGASEEKKVEPNDPSTKKKTTKRRRGRPRMPLEIVDIVVTNESKASAGESVGGDEFDQPVEISNEPDATDSDVNLEEIDLPDEDGLESDHDLPNVQIHKCDTCGIIKNNKSSLVRHQFEHNGIRPYPCK